jgi:hypothetical protein
MLQRIAEAEGGDRGVTSVELPAAVDEELLQTAVPDVRGVSIEQAVRGAVLTGRETWSARVKNHKTVPVAAFNASL